MLHGVSVAVADLQHLFSGDLAATLVRLDPARLFILMQWTASSALMALGFTVIAGNWLLLTQYLFFGKQSSLIPLVGGILDVPGC